MSEKKHLANLILLFHNGKLPLPWESFNPIHLDRGMCAIATYHGEVTSFCWNWLELRKRGAYAPLSLALPARAVRYRGCRGSSARCVGYYGTIFTSTRLWNDTSTILTCSTTCPDQYAVLIKIGINISQPTVKLMVIPALRIL